MSHDDHFLARLDRVPRQHVELALGLYRDHDLVRAILLDAQLAETDRVALALEDGGRGPHIVVARDGGFVTCLGQGMSTGSLPIVSRAHLEGLATRVERVRAGLALAKRRGLGESELLRRLESAGPGVSREEFLSASATVGPAVPLLAGMYASWATALDEVFPLLLSLQSGRAWRGPRRSQAERDLARGAWAMAHSAMVLVDSASREWVRDWASLEKHDKVSPWVILTMTSAFPFVVRAAWLAARLGKPMIASYKARFLSANDAVDVRESGWGLACMALRHASLRSEALRTLQSPPRMPEPHAPWVASSYEFFAGVARILEEKEDTLRSEALDLGRGFVVVRTERLPASSRHRYTKRADVPEELVLPGLFDAWYDAHNSERSADMMLLGVVAAARARAEDFYFPAAVLHAIGPEDLQATGASMVRMRRKFLGIPETARHDGRPGRNDPCSCGSGKKYKKCHGR